MRRARDARFRTDGGRYGSGLKDRGFTDIIKLGMAFSGDGVKVIFNQR